MALKKQILINLCFILLGLVFILPLFAIAKYDSGGGASATLEKMSGTLSKTTETLWQYPLTKSGLKLGTKDHYWINVFSKQYDVTDVPISPDKKVGDTYTCYYYDESSGPNFTGCVKGEIGDGGDSAPDQKKPTDPAASTTTGSTTTSGTTTAPKDDQPLTALLNKSASVLPSIVGTKNCPASGTYDSGILKGLQCSGPTKDSVGLLQIIQVIKNIIDGLLLPLASILFVLMFIAGGLLYITSAGNQPRIDLAKKTLTAAVVGLIIVVLAFAIIRIFVAIMGGGIV